MSEIYNALKRAEAERAALPPGEARTDRELLNELGAALGRIEHALKDLDVIVTNQKLIYAAQGAIAGKLDTLSGRALLDDFTRHATMPAPKRGRPRGKGKRT